MMGCELGVLLASMALVGVLSGCVDQSTPPEEAPLETAAQPTESNTPTVNPSDSADNTADEHRIIATSYATMQILQALDLDIIARSETAGELSEEFAALPTVGTAMSPDAEAIVMLEPTDIIGPDTLIESIKPTYDAAGIEATWIDLQSVEGLYESIAMLGEKYDRQALADDLIAEYETHMVEFQGNIQGITPPKVLVLMGLPGSYISCTNNSYVGSLVELAGADNVVKVDTIENFVNWNTEELILLDPDIILLTAHGLPDLAMEMFTEEFAENDIWKNFRAVENGDVYALDFHTFGMSATFDWTVALDDLKTILYDGTYDSFLGEVTP